MVPAHDTNLVDRLNRYSAERPGATAVITPQRRASWAELDAIVWSAAFRLHESGIRAADRIGIAMLHPVGHLVVSLALARIGAAQVALPVIEGKKVNSAIAETLGLKRILCDLPKLRDEIPRALLLDSLETRPVAPARKEAIAARDPALTWLILQSSGTTGSPKFAELSHGDALARFARYLPLFNCTENDIFWPVSRLDFVVAKQRTVYAMLAGASACLPVGMSLSREMVDFVRQAGVTLACGTPSHLHQLVAIGESIPSLRVFEARSAMIDEKLRTSFRTTVSPGLHIVYATNEAETITLADPALQAQVANTVGRPVAPLEVQVVDGEGRVLPAEQTGEVRVRGPGVASAYLDNPQATARSFRDGWFHPGDLAYLTQEGALVLLGRKDDMMIFDGMNIYPAEIENALLSHPAVREAAAFPARHERFQDVPMAAVTLSGSVSERALIEHCRNLIGIRHPRRVRIVQEFPRNAMGKILKRELVALAAGGAN